MKKLLFAIAGAAAFSAFAADPSPRQGSDIDVLGFENFDFTNPNVTGAVINRDDTGVENASKWSCSGDDASLVKTYGGENAAKGNGLTFPGPFEDEGDQYLALDTNGSELQRLIPAGSQTIAADGTYIDTLVQFTPSESAPTSTDLDDAKLAIWLGVDSEHNTTNLMVAGGFYSHAGLGPTAAPQVSVTNYTLSGTYEPGTWYRLTVKAIASLADDGSRFPGFQISIDGTELTTVEMAYDADALSWLTDPIEDPDTGDISYTVIPAKAALLTGKTFIPSADTARANATITSIGFKGTGAIDDFVVTTAAPDFTPAGIDFTLTWPSGLTAVSYTIDGGEPVAISGASPLSIPNLVGGEAITFIVQNADGAQKTLSATAANGEGIDATGTTFGWPEYLGDAVDSAYEIDDLAELILFQKGVAAGLATANTTFKLTADVALATAWPGIGIQDGKDLWSPPNGTSAEDIIIATNTYVNGAFKGTFDGQNHTISGFQMQGGGLDYCGFFNSIYGATICNLKIAYAGALFATDTTASSAESGGTFAGVTGGASTLRNLTTVAGTVSCSKGFGGIVGYLSDGTLVEYCTNNVNLTSMKPNKAGGIAMITQKGSAVTIRNCVNNGTIAGSNETGGLIGYIGLDVTIADCESVAAYKLMHHQGSTVTVQGTIKGNATVDSYSGQATPGLNFATVDGSVATFVADEALAAGNSYKAMHTATATYEFTAAGSISFDTNLIQAVTFAITAAQGLDAPTEATENGVVTFTVASQGIELEPGEQDSTVYTTQADATAALANVTIVEPEDVSTNETITAAAKTDYDAMFEAKVVEVAGGYAVTVGLTATAEANLQSQANADAGEIVEAIEDSTVSFTTTPGFYYSIKWGTSLDAMSNTTTPVLATGATLTLDLPKGVNATAGFYKVLINYTK